MTVWLLCYVNGRFEKVYFQLSGRRRVHAEEGLVWILSHNSDSKFAWRNMNNVEEWCCSWLSLAMSLFMEEKMSSHAVFVGTPSQLTLLVY